MRTDYVISKEWYDDILQLLSGKEFSPDASIAWERDAEPVYGDIVVTKKEVVEFLDEVLKRQRQKATEDDRKRLERLLEAEITPNILRQSVMDHIEGYIHDAIRVWKEEKEEENG